MWNHTQNCATTGDDDINDSDPNWMKEQLEKSLDLSQYLKYLDKLFAQPSSESDTSDSEDGERSQTFTGFRQPPTALQHPHFQIGQGQNTIFLGPSAIADYTNHLHSFTAQKPADHFHAESNISSSSLSSIDSGTSSLNVSTEVYHDSLHSKTDNNTNRVAKPLENVQADEEKSIEGNEDAQKKAQKKKKTGRNSVDSLPRNNKPGGGSGNGSSKGGSGSSSSGPGSSSSDNSAGSSGSSSNQSSKSSSSGAKRRSGKSNSQQPKDSPSDNKNPDDHAPKDTICNISVSNESANTDLQRALGICDSVNVDSLLLQDDLVDSFETEDSFVDSFPLLDSITDEESSISDFISMSTALHSTAPSSATQSSTNLFTKIAEVAAATAVTNSSFTNASNASDNVSVKDGTVEGIKRKLDSSEREKPCKLSRLTEKQKQSRIEYLNTKRRKIYVCISRKDVIKIQKSRAANFKEGLIIRRKLAQACARQVQKNALQSQKCMKESVFKAKRLTQEMETYWKSVNKTDKELQRKIEREIKGWTKKDCNRASEVQNKKIGYLIAQIELFVNKLLNNGIIEVDEDDLIKYFHEVQIDERMQILNSEILKSSVHSTIDRAVSEHHSLVKMLDMSGIFLQNKTRKQCASGSSIEKMANGLLKSHQIFGVNWIKNLYNKGLNGVLADESSMGKRVQVAGFLSHLVDSYSLWGPFLIVTPLHSIDKWVVELSRMCSKFKVILYRGKPMERRTLRYGWEKSGKHTEEAGFHVVVTSYQVMTEDLKYFSTTKWQYLVMDDPQSSITSSTKWMALLSFRCRNKLLLCGNPRLNSLSHLCSYLYFIMPALFDSSPELSEWLITQLESPFDKLPDDKNNTLGRLQRIIQIFLLRRECKDVEQGRTQCCIYTQVACVLTRRQRQIYSNLLEKASIGKLLVHVDRCRPEEIRARIVTALNLSVQLRQVCNHPNLVEESFYSTPYFIATQRMTLPLIVGSLLIAAKSLNSQIGRRCCIFRASNIYNSLFEKTCDNKFCGSTWSFVRLLNLSWEEVEDIFVGGNSVRLNHLVSSKSLLESIHYHSIWKEPANPALHIWNFYPELLVHFLSRSKSLSALVLTCPYSVTSSSRQFTNSSWLDSLQYRSLRTRGLFQRNQNDQDQFRERAFHYGSKFQCYVPPVYSGGYKVCTTSRNLNRIISGLENQIPFYEFVRNIDQDNLLDSDFALNVKLSIDLIQGSSSYTAYLPDNELVEFVGTSGKMMKLNELLCNLKQQKRRVLLISFNEDCVALLENFMKRKRWVYQRLEQPTVSAKHGLESPFVFIMYARAEVLEDFEPNFDSVIFFDHDWDTSLEDQKYKLLNKIGHQGGIHRDHYVMICNGTIEERIMSLTKERNIVSLTLSKGMFESKDLSSVPVLKSLVSVLMNENSQGRGYGNKTLSPRQIAYHETSDLKYKKGRITAPCTRYNDGFESASPSCSEDHEVCMDDEDGCSSIVDEENFALSFDEGYMGMSPDSFEDVKIKSDYEEHSSPTRTRIGRGAGKRGRPLSRARINRQNQYDNATGVVRKCAGRPRLKVVGPTNQGSRGRKPGRPPLTKKAETISSGLASLSSGPNTFGFYSSSDLELS